MARKSGRSHEPQYSSLTNGEVRRGLPGFKFRIGSGPLRKRVQRAVPGLSLTHRREFNFEPRANLINPVNDDRILATAHARPCAQNNDSCRITRRPILPVMTSRRVRPTSTARGPARSRLPSRQWHISSLIERLISLIWLIWILLSRRRVTLWGVVRGGWCFCRLIT
jgi:hypothetical protein